MHSCASRRQFLVRSFAGLAAGSCVFKANRVAASSGNQAIQFVYGGRSWTGLPLLWTRTQGLVLGRDGQFVEVQPAACESLAAAGVFEPFTPAELRAKLQDEYGRGYEVQASRSYLVVQPRGAGNRWPLAFESLHRELIQAFTVRGVPLRQGRFPLIAVVAPSAEEFHRLTAAAGHRVSGSTLGVYSIMSNRILMFDHGDQAGGTSSTVRHEAAHQTAFNFGLQMRMADNPQWFAEGMGTFFESPLGNQGARDPLWRQAFLKHFPQRQQVSEALLPLLERDATFKTSTEAGYALAWALTGYLLERMPSNYGNLTQLIGQLQPLAKYSPTQRRDDFFRCISDNLGQLAQHVHRWGTSG